MNRLICIFVLLAVFCSSCEDFLESRDKSAVLEDDLFANQEGVEEAMYGLYVTLVKNSMYGKTFPLTMDLLGQYYTIGHTEESETEGIMDVLLRHEHKSQTAIDYYKQIWQTAYKFISDANKVLENLDKWEGKPLKFGDMYCGEVLGLRAYVHLDLLRMFGSVHQENRGIPYVTTYGMYVTPFSTTGECYDKIIADLKAAEKLLVADEQYLTYPRQPEDEYNLYVSDRVAHFNLYAVKATLARVYWTRNNPGDLDSAGMYAREVIESERFPLPADGSTITANYFISMLAGVIDDTEGIFGLYTSDTYTQWKDLFLSESGGYRPANTLLYARSDLKNDHRKEWIGVPNVPDLSSTGQMEQYGYRYLKLIDRQKLNPSDKIYAGVGFTGINLIRVPEMYLILAESLLETSPEEARKVFEAYTFSRGMGNYEGTLTEGEIDLEFKKEYAQEGQYWFRLKRRQISVLELIPDIGGTIVMNEDKWNLTIPDEEFEFRPEGTY